MLLNLSSTLATFLTFALCASSQSTDFTTQSKPSPVPQNELLINTRYGPVRGHYIQKQNTTIREFLGIPYARAPTGALRFEPPLPPHPWRTPRNTTAFGPSCIQVSYTSPIFGAPGSSNSSTGGSGISLPPPANEGEDCLSINIWAPRNKPWAKKKLPVLLWTYGGGFMVGSSDTPLYNGGNWVAKQKGEVIVVSLNYRLNVFGYPGAPGLRRQNAGLWDVRKAVEWVRDNIEKFGGDKKRITLFGESAGGGATDAYLYFNQKDPIINGAIMQSGSIEIILSREQSGELNPVKNWLALARALNCSSSTAPSNSTSHLSNIRTLACMKRISATKLRTAISRENLVFGPNIDNKALYADTLARLDTGKFAQVPVLVGSNDQETLGNTPEALKRTRESFTCPAARSARGHSKVAPTWFYRYFGNFTTRAGSPPLGPYHGSEIVQVFGNFPVGMAIGDQQKKSSEYLQGAWTEFAKDPKGGLRKLGWPTFKEDEKTLVVLAKENAVEATFENPEEYIKGC